MDLLPGRPDAHYHLGRGYALSGNYDGALESLATAIRCDTGFLPARLLRSLILERTGQVEPARAELAEARRTTRGGWRTSWLTAHEATGKGDWDAATREFDALIRSSAMTGEPYLGFRVELHVGKGYASLEAGDHDSAVESFSAAAGLWPNSPQPRLLRALAYYLSGRETRAERQLEDLAARPEYRDETALFACAMHNRRWEREDSLRWIRRMRPCYVRWGNEANLCSTLGDWEGAIRAGEEAVRLSAGGPNQALALAHLGTAKVGSGDVEGGDRCFSEAIALAPENFFIHHVQGFALLARRDRWDDALDAMNRCLELEPTCNGARINKAYLFRQRGEYQKALDECALIIDNDPDSFWGYLHRAATLRAMGRWRDTRPDAENAFRLAPRCDAALFQMAVTCWSEGKLDEAEEWFQKVVKESPKSTFGYRHLGKLRACARADPVGGLEAYGQSLLHCPAEQESCSRRAAVVLRQQGWRPDLAEGFGRVLDELEEATRDEAARASGPLLRTLALGRLRIPGRRDPERALEYARAALEKLPDSAWSDIVHAECLRAVGDDAGAAASLRRSISRAEAPPPDAWVEWLAACLRDRSSQPGDLLARIPRPAGRVADSESTIERDVRWLLEELAAGHDLRINCGDPEEYVTPAGEVWSRDRLVLGGEPFGTANSAKRYYEGDIEGTDCDRIYQTHRWFYRASRSFGGYRIPVVPGRYRVRLHVTETYFREPGRRTFSVRVEDRLVLEGLDPAANGFATAWWHEETDLVVEDGVLDIVLVPGTENPVVSGIEIEPLSGRRDREAGGAED